MNKLTLTLEWFLNPDHLPMIAGIQSGQYAQHGIELTLLEPSEHYDGMSALHQQQVDLHSNEPLHLFEQYHPDLRALGSFFTTDGGVLMRRERMGKLQYGERVRICSPVSEPMPNRIGFEILRRYAHKNGFTLLPENVEFIKIDFNHINNLINNSDLDGAWLCFHNFEVIEAQHKNLDCILIDQHVSPYANFSALEFITTQQILTKKGATISEFLRITDKMVQLCQSNLDLARQYYYTYTHTEPDALTDAIIADTVPRLLYPTTSCANIQRWQDLRHMLAEMDVLHLSDSQYQTLFQAA